MRLLEPLPGETILDLGAGQGVLCPAVVAAGAEYVGVDLSERLLAYARKHHSLKGKFIQGDATRLAAMPDLNPASFEAAVFLLSLQDMDPLEAALDGAAWALRPGGRVVILLTHPCFRIPRQSGWGWDPQRKLQFRRVDRYLSPLPVPLKAYPGQAKGVSTSFHRPLSSYISGLGQAGLLVDAVDEIPVESERRDAARLQAQKNSDREIPLFLVIRAIKIEKS
jgi:SAM-dependent methyltransferase